jgi:hypothetical protein
MNAAQLRSDLFKTIEAMNVQQLKDIYGLLQNYFNSNDNSEDRDTLTTAQKKAIEIGIKQADMGMTTPLSEVTSALRKKYGLND